MQFVDFNYLGVLVVKVISIFQVFFLEFVIWFDYRCIKAAIGQIMALIAPCLAIRSILALDYYFGKRFFHSSL